MWEALLMLYELSILNELLNDRETQIIEDRNLNWFREEEGGESEEESEEESSSEEEQPVTKKSKKKAAPKATPKRKAPQPKKTPKSQKKKTPKTPKSKSKKRPKVSESEEESESDEEDNIPLKRVKKAPTVSQRFIFFFAPKVSNPCFCSCPHSFMPLLLCDLLWRTHAHTSNV